MNPVNLTIIRKEREITIPYMGIVHAGKTIGFQNPSEEETSETMDMNTWVLSGMDPNAAALFKAEGESMSDAGIIQGDILLIERTDKYKINDIVIAEIDGSVTVKYYWKDSRGKQFLRSANPDIPDWYPQELLNVIGIVKRVIRFYGC